MQQYLKLIVCRAAEARVGEIILPEDVAVDVVGQAVADPGALGPVHPVPRAVVGDELLPNRLEKGGWEVAQDLQYRVLTRYSSSVHPNA